MSTMAMGLEWILCFGGTAVVGSKINLLFDVISVSTCHMMPIGIDLALNSGVVAVTVGPAVNKWKACSVATSIASSLSCISSIAMSTSSTTALFMVLVAALVCLGLVNCTHEELHLLDHVCLNRACLRLLGVLVGEVEGSCFRAALGSQFFDDLIGKCGGRIPLLMEIQGVNW